jgi:hypothetical protein
MKFKFLIALVFLAICLLALGGMTVRGVKRTFGRGAPARRPVRVAPVPRLA